MTVDNVDNVDDVDDDVDGHSNDKREFYHLLLSTSIADEAKDQ